MRHLKRLTFTLLGLALVTAPAIIMIYAMTLHDQFNATIGNIIGLTFIGILITFLTCIFGILTNKMFEDHGYTAFPAFFLVSFQKRKRLYHSTMGEFELLINEKNMDGTLIKQGFFYCLTISIVDIERTNFMETIKLHLDDRYQKEIKEIEERKRKKKLVGKLMKEEGYLDTAGKRDDKLEKLGIK